MAVIDGAGDFISKGVYKISWTTLTNGDSGSPTDGAGHSDKTVQVLGTFGASGQCDIEGSNDGGTTWHVLNDTQGNALNITTAQAVQILEAPALIRPNISNGDGTTDLDVHLVARAPD